MNKANSIIDKFNILTNLCLNYIYSILLLKNTVHVEYVEHTQRMQDFLNTGKLSYIYKYDLDKACFQHDMAYNKFKDLEKRTQSNIVLKNKWL